MRFFIPLILLIGSAVFVSNAAHAQLWLKDREEGEGPGFKLGKSLVLHTGLGVEFGADSNVNYTKDNVPAGRFRLTPYVDVASRSAQRMESNDVSVQQVMPTAIFRFGLAAFYDRYFGSHEQEFRKYNTKTNPFGVNSHLSFTVLPERKVSLFGGFSYLKTLEPYETNSDAQNKHNVVPYLGIRIMPGGGTLTIEPKYRLDLLVFDDPIVGRDSNRIAHEVSLSTNWKIFPKTALISNVMFRPTVYFGDYAANVDSYPLRSWIGAQGLIFENLGFRALVGYGVGFYEKASSFEGLIGDLAVMFHMSRVSHMTVGMKRDFVDSFYANYYIMNGGYMSMERMFVGRFLLKAEGNLFKRNYAFDYGYKVTEYGGSKTTTEANTTDRVDVWLTLNFLAELRATSWLSFHMSLKIWKDISDFAYDKTTEYDDNSEPVLFETEYAEFTKAEFLVGARGHF
ncbi:MAG: hypothetical protein JXX14_21225 [Deltaproteobacteria bacterium]|nr:hypothetical protein [Deltaproteobacteria bacterium]